MPYTKISELDLDPVFSEVKGYAKITESDLDLIPASTSYQKITEADLDAPEGFVKTAVKGIGTGLLDIPGGLAGLEKGAGEIIQKLPIPGAETYGKALENIGGYIGEKVKQAKEYISPQTDTDGKKFVFQAAELIGNSLPMLGAGVLANTASIPLIGMATQAGGAKYEELRQKGATPEKAALGGAAMAAAQMATAAIPVTTMFSKAPWLQKGLKFLASDVGGMEAATIIGDGINKAAADETTTWGQMWDQVKETAMLASVTAPIQAAVIGFANSMQKPVLDKTSKPATIESTRPTEAATMPMDVSTSTGAAAPEIKSTVPVEPQISQEITPKQAEVAPTTEPSAVVPEGAVAASGLRYGEELPEHAAGIGVNLKRLEDYDNKFFANQQFEQNMVEFYNQKRNVIPNEETKTKAQELIETYKINPGTILGLKPGKILNAEQSYAVDMIAENFRQRAREASAKAVNGTEQDLKDAQDLAKISAVMSIKAQAVGSEIGRALQARNIGLKKSEAVQKVLDEYDYILKNIAGYNLTKEMLGIIGSIDPKNHQQLDDLLRNLPRTTTRKKIFEWWLGSVLSGPVTQVANIASNIVNAGFVEPSKTFSNAIADKVLYSMGKKKSRDVLVSQAWKEFYKFWASSNVGFNTFVDTFNSNQQVMSGGTFDTGVTIGQIRGRKGEIIRVPLRLLHAADQSVKSMVYASKIQGLADLKAFRDSKGNAAKYQKLFEQYSTNPTAKMRDIATSAAISGTFQDRVGIIGNSLMKIREAVPGTEYLFPFIKTLVNVSKKGVSISPVGVPYHAVKTIKSIRQGKFDAATSEQIGSLLFSLTTSAAVMSLASAGLITGRGPADKELKKQWLAEGNKEYSIKTPCGWVSYATLEPVATAMGIAADLVYRASHQGENETELEAIGNALVYSILNNVVNKTWMQALKGVVNISQDPFGKPGQQFLRSTGGGFIAPNASKFLADTIDNTVRDTTKISDYFKTKYPIVSYFAPPKLDYFGENPVKTGRLYNSAMTTGNSVTAKIVTEMARVGANINEERYYLNGKDGKITLTPEQRNEMLKDYGPKLKKALLSIANSNIPDEGKRIVFEKTISEFRKNFHAKYYNKFKGVQ